MAHLAPAARFSKARQNRKVSNCFEIPALSANSTPSIKKQKATSEPSSAQKSKLKLTEKRIYQKWSPIIESEKIRQTEEPQFHLQSLCNSSNPNVVLLKFGCFFKFQVDLASLRIILCLVNLITLVSSVMSFQAWIWVEDIKLETTKGKEFFRTSVLQRFLYFGLHNSLFHLLLRCFSQKFL